MSATTTQPDAPPPLRVTVIVPVYNGRAFIDDCLRSLRAQTYPDVEIVVVDDGSTDGTPERVTPPARLISTGGRRGPGYARNAGARHATGGYLLFTDADVRVPPEWVARTVATIRERGVKGGGGGYAGPVGTSFTQRFAHAELDWRRRHMGGYVSTLVSNNLFCERDLFLRLGGFPENYRAASSEDMEFSWKLSRDHQLWWDRENGVYHNYADTPRAYLAQQWRFARDAVPMLLGTRGLAVGKTHHPKSLYVEVALTGLAALAVLALQGRLALALGVLLALMNAGFFARLASTHSVLFALRGALMVLARNAVIVAGALAGLWLWVVYEYRAR